MSSYDVLNPPTLSGLAPGESMAPNQAIVSPNGRFKLKFRSTNETTKLAMTMTVGAQFEIPLWQTNEDLPDPEGLQLHRDGYLQVVRRGSLAGGQLWTLLPVVGTSSSQTRFRVSNDGVGVLERFVTFGGFPRWQGTWNTGRGNPEIAAGIYRITSPVDQNTPDKDMYVADMRGGDWQAGDVIIHPKAVSPDIATIKNQRWMVIPRRNINNQMFHVIFNLNRGVFAGRFTRVRGVGTTVSVSPSNLDSMDILWALVAVGNAPGYRIYDSTPNARVWCTSGQRGPSWPAVAVVSSVGVSENLTTFGLAADAAKNTRSPTEGRAWMKAIGDKVQLARLNLNGFKLEKDNGGVDLAPSPYDYLLAGLRYVKVPFQVCAGKYPDQKPCLMAADTQPVDAVIPEGFSLAALLLTVQLFLAEQPSETVLVHIQKAVGVSPGDGSAGSAADFAAAFESDFKFFKDGSQAYFDLRKRRFVDVRLAEVRGRMMIIADSDALGLPLATFNSIWG